METPKITDKPTGDRRTVTIAEVREVNLAWLDSMAALCKRTLSPEGGGEVMETCRAASAALLSNLRAYVEVRGLGEAKKG